MTRRLVVTTSVASVVGALLLAVGYWLWAQSRENCRYAGALAVDASKTLAVIESALADDLILANMDRGPLDTLLSTRVGAAGAITQRRPNMHLTTEAQHWLAAVKGGGSYVEHAAALGSGVGLSAYSFRCSLPEAEDAGSPTLASGLFQAFPTPGKLRGFLAAVTNTAQAALRTAQIKAQAIRAEAEARERARIAEEERLERIRRAVLLAEIKNDGDAICRNRGIVSQAIYRYEQFLNLCNGYGGGQYYDCTQNNADVMALQVRQLVSQRYQVEREFVSKWGEEASCR